MKRKEFILKSGLGIGTALITPQVFASLPKQVEAPGMAAKIIRSTEGKKLNVIGDNMTLKLTGEDTNGQFALVEEYNDPGTGIPRHIHEHEDEVFTVLEGEIEMEVDDKIIVLKAGDIGYAPRGVEHSWRVIGTQKARVNLSIFPAGMELMFQELANLPAGPPDPDKVTAICGRYGIKFV